MWNSRIWALVLGFFVCQVAPTPVADNSGLEVMKTLVKRSADLNSGLDVLATLTVFSSNDDCHRLRSLLPTVRNSVTTAYSQATDLAAFLSQVYATTNGCLSNNIINDTVCLTGQAVVVKNGYVSSKDSYASTAQALSSSVTDFGEALLGCFKSL